MSGRGKESRDRLRRPHWAALRASPSNPVELLESFFRLRTPAACSFTSSSAFRLLNSGLALSLPCSQAFLAPKCPIVFVSPHQRGNLYRPGTPPMRLCRIFSTNHLKLHSSHETMAEDPSARMPLPSGLFCVSVLRPLFLMAAPSAV